MALSPSKLPGSNKHVNHVPKMSMFATFWTMNDPIVRDMGGSTKYIPAISNLRGEQDFWNRWPHFSPIILENRKRGYIGGLVFPITVINLERYSYTFSIVLCSDVSETHVITKIKRGPGRKLFIRFLTFNASEACQILIDESGDCFLLTEKA